MNATSFIFFIFVKQLFALLSTGGRRHSCVHVNKIHGTKSGINRYGYTLEMAFCKTKCINRVKRFLLQCSLQTFFMDPYSNNFQKKLKYEY